MAAFMGRCAPTLGPKRQILSCFSIIQKTNKKMASMVVVCASLHTQRRIVQQMPQINRYLLKCQRQRQITFAIPALTARWNSSAASSGAGAATPPPPPEFINPPGYIPPTPAVPVPEPATDLMEGLNALGEPTMASLGLGSYWPSGLVQQALEMLHVNIGLPWWGSIVMFTVCLRICMFPVMIKSQRTALKMQTHMPVVQKLQLKMTQARQRGDMLAAMQHGSDLSNYMQVNKVNPLHQFGMILVQIPVFASMFVGLRGMANLPVESMQYGGILWFPDLTVSTPFYGLPLLTSLTLLLTIELGADGVSSQSQTHMLKWVMRGLPVLMLPVISNFPAAMLVYWFSSNTFTLGQVLLLKIPSVRAALNLPKPPKPELVTVGEKKGFVEGFKESWSNMKATQAVNERERLDEVAFRKAAQGPIIKTYSYNPKKVKGQLKLAQSKSTKTKRL